MAQPIGFKPTFKPTTTIETGGGEVFKTAEIVPYKTKVLNERLERQPWESIYTEVPAGFNSNGATIPLLNLILVCTFLNLLTDYFWLEFLTSLIILIAFLAKTSAAVWFMGVGHDWWWGKKYIDADVLDDTTGEIIENLGRIEVTFKDGNNFAKEKLEDLFANSVLIISIFVVLEIARLLKGKK